MEGPVRLTAEELSVMDAAEQGQKAGERGNGASQNPYQDGTPEHLVWENNRSTVIAYRLNSRVKLAGFTC